MTSIEMLRLCLAIGIYGYKTLGNHRNVHVFCKTQDEESAIRPVAPRYDGAFINGDDF